MSSYSDSDQLYQSIKSVLHKANYIVNPYRDIMYGIQFLIFKDNNCELLRIFVSKKGIRLDFSKIKQIKFLKQLRADLDSIITEPTQPAPLFDPNEKDVELITNITQDPTDVIGIANAGKSNFFGPLVLASVKINDDDRDKLLGLGIENFQRLNPSTLTYIANKIRKKLNHTCLTVGNMSYNKVFDKVKNLNHLMAWGNLKIIEDNINQSYCPNVLCSEYGNAQLLKKSLLAKKVDVTLYQRPQAETNLAVGCAHILALDTLNKELAVMQKSYNFTFPTGSSNDVIEATKEFIRKFSQDELLNVTKDHFKITDQLNLTNTIYNN
tara:strand:+ start:203 stop:1174 length:972 start_codon:yes stop_codon:yes gene_type:complete